MTAILAPPMREDLRRKLPVTRVLGLVSYACLREEIKVLRWCLDWLERLERREEVVVNLRPATEDATEFVPFDRPWIPTGAREDCSSSRRSRLQPACHRCDDGREGESKDSRVRHRRRLVKPEPTPRRLSAQEERAALRQALGLLPYTRR